MKNKETKHLINEMKCVFPSYSVNESLARSLAFSFVCPGESHGVRACGYKVRGERSGDKRRRSRLPRHNRRHHVTYEALLKPRGYGHRARRRLRLTDITRAMEPLFTTDPDNERPEWALR